MKLLVTILALMLLVPLFAQSTITNGPFMPQTRTAHFQFNDQAGKVWMIGGHTDGFNALNTANYYTPGTGTVTSLTLTSIHDMCSVTKLSDHEYMVLGGAESTMGIAPGVNNCEIINTLTNTTTAINPMIQPRMIFSSTKLASGKVLVAGAWYNDTGALSGEIWNNNTGLWTYTGDLSTPRAMPGIYPTDDGNAVVFGGTDAYGNARISSVELYHSETNSYSLLSNQLFPDETGWTYVQGPWLNVKNNAGNYIGLASKQEENTTYYTLFTFNPANYTFTKLPVIIPPFSPSEVFDVSNNLIYDTASDVVYLLARIVSTTNHYRVMAVSSLTQTDDAMLSFDGIHALNGTNWTPLPNHQAFITGGRTSPDNYDCVANTYLLTMFQPTPVNDETVTPLPSLRLNCVPNPTSTHAVLQLKADYTSRAVLKVYDAKGHKVWQQNDINITPGDNSIDISSWTGGQHHSGGLYIARLETDRQSFTGKIILK